MQTLYIHEKEKKEIKINLIELLIKNGRNIERDVRELNS
jgi:hypothetical protein